MFNHGLGRWGSVPQGAVRPDGIVLNSPLFKQYFHILHGIENLQVQEFISHLAIERLYETVLPGAARLDEERFHRQAIEPLT